MAGNSAPRNAISIHAPRVGSDQSLRMMVCLPISISIHAPRVGSDSYVLNKLLLSF